MHLYSASTQVSYALYIRSKTKY